MTPRGEGDESVGSSRDAPPRSLAPFEDIAVGNGLEEVVSLQAAAMKPARRALPQVLLQGSQQAPVLGVIDAALRPAPPLYQARARAKDTGKWRGTKNDPPSQGATAGNGRTGGAGFGADEDADDGWDLSASPWRFYSQPPGDGPRNRRT